MIRCTAEHGQPMNLIVREGHRCYVLQQSRTKSIVNYVPALYSELPFYACAGGKVLMSELPISLVEKLVDSCDTTESPLITAAAYPFLSGTVKEIS